MQSSMCKYLYFQFRGASNAVGKLVEKCSGDKSQMTIVTHSSGNHAQAIALASKLCGVQAHIIMPMDAPAVKKESVKGYGAQITECAENTKEVSHKWYLFKHLLILTHIFVFIKSREASCASVLKSLGTNGHLIHPSDNVNVIAGQGTIALEVLEQVHTMLFINLS